MTDLPPPVNTVASGIGTGISALGGAIVSTVDALIIADVPWLDLPGIKQIWEALFQWIAGYFVKAAQNGATFAVIDVQVGDEEDNVSQALAELIAAEKSGDPNAIKQAIQNYANAQSALIRDDGSSPATGLQ